MRLHCPIPFLLSAFLLITSCAQQPQEQAHEPRAEAAEEFGEAHAWQVERMRDPVTGEVPDNIRALELLFARTLPKRDATKSLSWVHRGPINRGGRTRAFGIDRTDANVLIAGGVSGGIWRSTDGGQSWSKTLAPQVVQAISCLAQDPRPGQEDTWYAGTGENYGIMSGASFSALLSGSGIYKSTDNGQSWNLIPSTEAIDYNRFNRNYSFKQVNHIEVDPTRNDSDVVLAAVFNGIFRSNDGGTSWKAVLGLDTTITQYQEYTDLRVTTTGVWYAAFSNPGAQKGIWRSTDGLTWTNIGAGIWPANAVRTVPAIDPSDENTVYFFGVTANTGTQGHSLWKYTYLSGNGTGTGGQWTNLSANLPNGSCTGYFTFDFGYINSQDGYDMCLAVHPTQPNVIFLGGTSLYRSTNGFTSPDSTTWIGGYRCNTADPKSYVYPEHHPDQHWVQFHPADPAVLFSTNDGGVQKTTDALADSVLWTDLNNGYLTTQFYTVAIEEGSATSPNIIGGTQDNGCWYAMNDQPLSAWKYVHQDDGAYVALPEGQPFQLSSSQQGRLYKKTIDANGTITGYERIDPTGGTSSYSFINPFILDPGNNNRLYWVSANKIWRNNDLAGIPVTNNFYNKIPTNWELIDGATLLSSQRIASLDISAADPSFMIYGTVNGKVYRCDSLDTNPQKVPLLTSATLGQGYVSCVAANDLDPNEWLITISNYNTRSIYYTNDRGNTWTDVSANLEQNVDGSGNGPAVFWALIYPTWGGQNNRYFVGTSTGLYSTDVMDSVATVWEQEGPATIGNVPINMIAARGSDGTIVVGTHGNGVYSASLPAAPIGMDEASAGPELAAPWPNPATDEVNLLAYQPRAGRLQVIVYDLSGRAVVQRDLGQRPAGNIRWTWDLRSDAQGRVPAGTYLVQFRAADGTSKAQRVVVR
ncbi:MAG: T9SS type A sorting domain-containing protein [Flavobacteriales bacterium]|nr:T9SS type A sorting domain-containing protein [Flavobacteriales bacterium]